jgi:hypothetical protein
MTDRFVWRIVALLAAVFSGSAIAGAARAQGATSDSPPQIAPSPNPGYWTKERMQNARPMEKHPAPGYQPSQQSAPNTEGSAAGAGESSPPPQQGRAR